MNSEEAAIPVKPFLRPYKTVADLIGQIAGEKCEVVLHDLSDPLHSVVYVVNGHVTGREPGQGLRHLVPEMLMLKTEDFLPLWWFRHEEKLIRSHMMLIRNAMGEIEGALCANMDATADLQALERLKSVLPGLGFIDFDRIVPPGSSGVWSGEDALSVTTLPNAARGEEDGTRQSDFGVFDVVSRLIDAMVENARSQAPDGALSREDRQALIAAMESRGIFLVKGALERTASKLGLSKVTVYSDLDAIRHKDEPA